MKGKKIPRIFTPPLRELTPETSLGYEFIDFCENDINQPLLDWQKWLSIHALEIVGDLNGDWSFRFRYVIVLVSRQNGKTYWFKLLGLFFNYVLGTKLVIGTAQNLDKANSTFDEAVDLIEETPELNKDFVKVLRAQGKREYVLKHGERWKVVATNRRGRGWSSDLILMDELREQIDWEGWSAISKTMLARPSAILVAVSNAGDVSSVVLRHLRMQAHSQLGDPDGIVKALGDSETPAESDGSMLGLFEWSADPNADPGDPEAWAQANPSLGYTIEEATIRAAYADDPEDVFKTECLCQWVTSTVTPPFPVDSWDKGKDEKSRIADNSPLWFGVDVSSDRTHASIAVCGKREDGNWHVELAEYRTGTGWLVKWFQNAAPNYEGMKVALQSKGAPIASMMDVLAAIDGVEIVECHGKDVAGWCGRLYDAVAACADESDAVPVYHITQPALDLAANIASTRPMGDGAWAWDRNKSMEDISPLVAVTMAFGAATQVEAAEKSTIYDSIYNTRGVLVV